MSYKISMSLLMKAMRKQNGASTLMKQKLSKAKDTIIINFLLSYYKANTGQPVKAFN